MPHVMVSTKTQENKDHLCGWETGGELTSKKILEISCTLMVGKVWYNHTEEYDLAFERKDAGWHLDVFLFLTEFTRDLEFSLPHKNFLTSSRTWIKLQDLG